MLERAASSDRPRLPSQASHARREVGANDHRTDTEPSSGRAPPDAAGRVMLAKAIAKGSATALNGGTATAKFVAKAS